MRLTDLIVESRDRETTGSLSIDSLLESVKSHSLDSATDLPINARSSEWETLVSPTRIARLFEFDSANKLKYFVNELISYQELKNHHSLIKIDGYSVTVESYTHDVNTVTSLDLSLAKFCDEIYEDTRFFNK